MLATSWPFTSTRTCRDDCRTSTRCKANKFDAGGHPYVDVTVGVRDKLCMDPSHGRRSVPPLQTMHP